MRLVSWNNHQLALWDQLAVRGAELALLQEAPRPPRSAAPASHGWPEEILPGAGETWAIGEHSPWRSNSTIAITLDTWSHAIPAMQEEAAALIAGLVFATK